MLLFLLCVSFAAILLLLKLFTIMTKGHCKSSRCLLGKTALITGANSGIGFHTALDLAKRGCKVIIGDVVNAEESTERIKSLTGNESVYWLHIDLGSLRSVRSFSKIIHEREQKIDILINNAGASGFNGQVTEDGIQKTFHINHVGGFLLTHLMLDLLKKGDKARVIFVSSIYAFLHVLRHSKQINRPLKIWDKKMYAIVDYGNSKLCNIAVANVLARKLAEFGITCNSLFPGMVWTKIHHDGYKAMPGSNVLDYLLFSLYIGVIWLYSKTPTEGAQTTINCAVSKKLETVTGEYFVDGVPFWQPRLAQQWEFCEGVFRESEILAQLDPSERI